MLKHDGKYYMTYLANDYKSQDYAVGYAVSDHPLGDYVKAPENPVLECYREVSGTGHSYMLQSPEGELLICYHGRTEATGQDRVGFISPARFTEAGKLEMLP